MGHLEVRWDFIEPLTTLMLIFLKALYHIKKKIKTEDSLFLPGLPAMIDRTYRAETPQG